MMNYGYMMGSGGGAMMLFSWVSYLLVVVLLVLGVAALWKYLNQK